MFMFYVDVFYGASLEFTKQFRMYYLFQYLYINVSALEMQNQSVQKYVPRIVFVSRKDIHTV